MRTLIVFVSLLLVSIGCGESPDLPGFGPEPDAQSGDAAVSLDDAAPPDTVGHTDPDGTGAVDDIGGTDAALNDAETPDQDAEEPADVDDAGQADAGEEDAAEDTVLPPAGPCTVTEDDVTCEHETTVMMTGFGGFEARDVHWALPAGEAPEGGWPVALMFQGSLFSAQLMWSSPKTELYGAWYLAMTVKELLEAGYAVITPEAHAEGTTFWDTNIAPYNWAWTTSPDHQFMLDLLAGITTGDFGPLNADRLYATGISSGGYMTSRFALTYPGVRAIAIHSASYATCAGSLCYVPALPEDHVPTLFLHGTLDAVVPQWTMELYRNELQDQGTEVSTVLDPAAGHQWLEAAPAAIVDWFEDHP